MKITLAEFVKSAFKPSDYPVAFLPEVAFTGRSNVGKSSLINVLVNRKNLVKTSSSPGKTQSINFFNINNKITFVDFPGYGYAKVPIEVRKSWKPLIENYLKTRKHLKLAILIFDVRRIPTQEDINLVQWFDFHKIPVLLILNKIDKLSKSRLKRQAGLIKKSLPPNLGNIILFSAVTKEGKSEVWKQLLYTIEQTSDTMTNTI
ncbi:MAG: ribosome biogenesis GTP-binding protein YihA/YsxC [Thermodesulfobacteriota bacterium]|nr:ribosome biogenesis GTP-binding protein YihA/YsxC [Thermodesulfobacteriota bacterium]